MIKLKDILDEKISDVRWLDKAYRFAMDNKFPLTPTIASIIYKNKRVRAFHLTSPKDISKMESVQGSKKSLSCMTRIPNDVITSLFGVWKKGALFYLEGTLVLKAKEDVMSEPDEQGRRWFVIGVDSSSKLNVAFQKLINNDKERNIYIQKIYSTKGKERNELLRKLIKRHIDLAEKFAKENAKKIKKSMTNVPDGSLWDEIILNEIELIDVIWDIYELGNKDPLIVKKAENKLKSIVSGEVITVDTRSENISSKVKAFVKKREGKLSKI